MSLTMQPNNTKKPAFISEFECQTCQTQRGGGHKEAVSDRSGRSRDDRKETGRIKFRRRRGGPEDGKFFLSWYI